MLDVAIKGGTVVDGTGRPGMRADVGITGERIVAIGDLADAEAGRTIDATGLTVAPGFIDPHTHSEGSLLADPQHAYGLRQGITTEFLGIDGLSYAPLSAHNFTTYSHWLGGLLGDVPQTLDMSSVASFRSHYHKKVSVNTVYLVPEAAIRMQIVGFHDRPLRGEDLERARRMLSENLDQGAVGMTMGSVYYPGAWADTEELVELCKVVREAGKVYMTEPRRTFNSAYGGGGAVEAMEIQRRSGVPLHFAHYRTKPETAGRLDQIMDPIDAMRGGEADVTFDVYPYPSGSSMPVSLLPSWAQEGGIPPIMARLKNPVERRRIAEHMEASVAYLPDMVFTYFKRNPELDGSRLPDLAAKSGRSLGDELCEVMLQQDLMVGYLVAPPADDAVWQQLNRDFMQLLARPDYMVCSDITPAGTKPHPRCYGAFPRFLGRLRREVGSISLEGMVHRMTDRTARRFGLAGRGRIEKGYFADVTIFDADRVNDTATYENPRQFPIGIPYVIVNGKIAVDNERCTGVFAGQAVP